MRRRNALRNVGELEVNQNANSRGLPLRMRKTHAHWKPLLERNCEREFRNEVHKRGRECNNREPRTRPRTVNHVHEHRSNVSQMMRMYCRAGSRRVRAVLKICACRVESRDMCVRASEPMPRPVGDKTNEKRMRGMQEKRNVACRSKENRKEETKRKKYEGKKGRRL